ncbi:UNVERIFIED_CONTAM: hypothetical protein HDU68_002569 [Siphonaria sp. JEL0065]|nr:hypothetical protein HDU68_002569 [Siphonaria sp. JEL0065]
MLSPIRRRTRSQSQLSLAAAPGTLSLSLVENEGENALVAFGKNTENTATATAQPNANGNTNMAANVLSRADSGVEVEVDCEFDGGMLLEWSPPSICATATVNAATGNTATSTTAGSNSSTPCNRLPLPHELIAKVFLLLSVPTRLAAASRALHAEFYGDAFLVATWLALHNHFASALTLRSLRPPAPVHPLLAAMKHPSRLRLVAKRTDVAEMLLRIEPFTSRYELQRMYRRALSLFNKCTDIVSTWGIELYGEEIRATVPFQKPPAIALPLQAPLPPLPNMPNVNAQPEGDQGLNNNIDEDIVIDLPDQPPQPPNVMEAILEHDEDAAQEPIPNNVTAINLHLRPTSRPAFPVDDRRLLLDATDIGDISTISHLLTNKALLLDPRVLADAFCRAWDNGDPFNLCTPHTGYLWPRCSASRYFVMEKIVQEEEEVVTVFLMQTQGGVPENLELGEEIVETVVHGMKICWELIEDERRDDLNGGYRGGLFHGRVKNNRGGYGMGMPPVVSRSCDVLLAAGILGEVFGDDDHAATSADATLTTLAVATPLDPAMAAQAIQSSVSVSGLPVDEMEGLEYMAGMLNETVFRGKKKAIAFNLWGLSAPFLQRAFDSFIAFGSVRMAALLLAKYSEWIHIKPCHLTAALDRYSLPLCYYLIEYAGADPLWEEDSSLAGYIRKPGDPSIFGGPTPSPTALDSAGRTCWSWALRKGVRLTERRWEGIVKLGPMTVSAAIDFFGTTMFDPCRDNMLGFRIGSAPVVRVLSKAIDSRFARGSKCVLFEAAGLGESRDDADVALYFVSRLGGILAEDLRNGDRERVMELLDAGAIVEDDVLLAAAAIADMPPGDWDEWPMAARCYRRVLVQRRLGLPIPSRKILDVLPDNVVNACFKTALYSTKPIYCNPSAANVYSLYQRRRHMNAAGVRINLVPVLERDLAVRIVDFAMENLRGLLKLCDDPAYPGEAYCFIKGMLQYGLRDKNLLRDEDEFFLPDDEWVRNSQNWEMNSNKKNKTVAVIGSGLAGMSAAHVLSQTLGFSVVLFERNPGLGMDAGSIPVPCDCDQCKTDSPNKDHYAGRIDVPMRSFFPGYYPYLTSLYDSLDIPYRQSDNSMSFFTLTAPTDPSLMFTSPKSFPTKLDTLAEHSDASENSPKDSYFSFSCYKLPPPVNNFFGIPDLPALATLLKTPAEYFANIVRSYRISRDYIRFLQYAVHCLDSGIIQQGKEGRGPLANTTFGQCMQKLGSGYSDAFWSVFLPLFSGACTCTFEDLKAFPAHVILEYSAICLPDGKMSFVTCGTKEVCDRLAGPVQKVLYNTTVVGIQHDKTTTQFTLTTVPSSEAHLPSSSQTPTTHTFDYVIFATQANQASRILKQTSSGKGSTHDNNSVYTEFIAKATTVLDCFPYTKSLVVCHTDSTLMPASRDEWRCLNFGVLEKHTKNHVDDVGLHPSHEEGYDVHGLAMCTHYSQMTQTEVPDSVPPLFQTTNPIVLPDSKTVISATWYERAIVRLDTASALKDLENVQGGGGGVWFVGSYVTDGIPLLESCVTSAVLAAKGIVEDANGNSGDLFLPKGMVERVHEHEKKIRGSVGFVETKRFGAIYFVLAFVLAIVAVLDNPRMNTIDEAETWFHIHQDHQTELHCIQFHWAPIEGKSTTRSVTSLGSLDKGAQNVANGLVSHDALGSSNALDSLGCKIVEEEVLFE